METMLRETLLELFSEAYTGPTHDYTWFIDNAPGSGLFGTLSSLSAKQASQEGPSGATIAAHAEHLRWSLELANRYARGEQPQADWQESWTVKAVDAEAWQRLRGELRREYETLYAALAKQEDFADRQMLTGVLALIPHAAYHLGAIRQLRGLVSREGHDDE
jgi:hypothetical protein